MNAPSDRVVPAAELPKVGLTGPLADVTSAAAHPPSLAEWRDAYLRAPDAVKAWVFELVEAHAPELEAAFCREVLANPAATRLLPADLLQQRLIPAIQRWLLFLFDPANATSPSAVIALQRHVGEIHAKVGVPWDLAAFGFRGFRRCLHQIFMQTAGQSGTTLLAMGYATALTDLAQAEMTVAQLSAQERAQRTPSAVQQNTGVSAGLDQPLLSLDEEERHFLHAMLSAVEWPSVRPLAATPLGHWVNHEAPLLFADTDHLQALQVVQQNLLRLDRDVLPRLQENLGNRFASQATLREMVAGLETIKQQIQALFDSLVATEGHRDALTQLFNRPLLGAILRREMGLARRKQSTFSVLLVSIDHLNSIEVQHGLVVSNRVLKHVAQLLAEQVRTSDYVFRYGPKEFMLLLVDLDAEQSVAVAEKIRSIVEIADLPMGDTGHLCVTLSLGVTTYAGQADTHALTQRAEAALQQAKVNGHNQVSML